MSGNCVRLWADLMGTALRRLNLAATVAGHAANIANTAATSSHLPNEPVCIGMAALVVKVMVADKLPATGLAEVFLLVIAGFAVSLYIRPLSKPRFCRKPMSMLESEKPLSRWERGWGEGRDK